MSKNVAWMNSSFVVRLCTMALIMATSLLLTWSCQVITEPTDIVPPGGMQLRVRVQDQSGNALPVTVEWKLLRNNVEQTQFALLAPRSNGLFSDALAIPVSDTPLDSVRVVIRTTYNGQDALDYARSLGFNGNARLDTIAICGEAFIPITLVKTIQPVCCGDVLPNQTLKVSADLPLQPNDTAYTVVVPLSNSAPCNVPVTIDAPVLSPGSARISTRAILSENGVQSVRSLPFTITPGTNTTVQWMFIFNEVSTAQQQTILHTVQLRISTQANASCVVGSGTLEQTTTVTTGCDCPSGIDTLTTVYAPNNNDSLAVDTVCVGAAPKIVTIQLPSIKNTAEAGCTISLSLINQQTASGVRVLSFNSSSSYTLTELKTGMQLGTMELAVQAQQGGNIHAEYTYAVRVTSPTGETKQCGKVRIVYNAIASSGSCVIDQSSSIFISGSFQTDTLHQCIGASSQSKTLRILNTSPCPLSINLALGGIDARLFSVVPLGAQTIPANGSISVTLKLLPTRSDVYPSGICDANTYITDFNAQLSITGCTPTVLPLKGKAHLERECTFPVPFTMYKHGQVDVSGTQWNTVIDLLPDNSLRAIDKRSLDSSAIYVKDITTIGPPPTATNITGAVLSNPLKGATCDIRFYKVASGQNILSRPICDLFSQFACQPAIAANLRNTNSSPWSCDININEGDIIIFYRNGLYGIMWINKLDWKERDARAIPGVQGEACFPFNF